MMKLSIFILLASFMAGCAPLEETDRLFSSSRTVTVAEVIEIAERYVNHRWVGKKEHIFHGLDALGVEVNTPDVSYREVSGGRIGWWVPHNENKGVPYKWGGFDTPLEFDTKLAAGKYAGDAATAYKREKLSRAVSREATGVDCSGFISRCWKLPRHYSTRVLPSLCVELEEMKDLSKGDILNKENEHVILFSHFTGRLTFLGYEAASEKIGKVRKGEFHLGYFQSKGYKPLRYRGLINPPNDAEKKGAFSSHSPSSSRLTSPNRKAPLDEAPSRKKGSSTPQRVVIPTVYPPRKSASPRPVQPYLQDRFHPSQLPAAPSL